MLGQLVTFLEKAVGDGQLTESALLSESGGTVSVPAGGLAADYGRIFEGAVRASDRVRERDARGNAYCAVLTGEGDMFGTYVGAMRMLLYRQSPNLQEEAPSLHRCLQSSNKFVQLSLVYLSASVLLHPCFRSDTSKMVQDATKPQLHELGAGALEKVSSAVSSYLQEVGNANMMAWTAQLQAYMLFYFGGCGSSTV